MPTVTIELYDETVQNEDDPKAVRLRTTLEGIVADYDTHLSRFEVENGVVTFHIPSKEACAAVLSVLASSTRNSPEYLLDEAGVATLSGTSFGKYGEGFIRLSYANSVENIKKALGWMKEAVAKL